MRLLATASLLALAACAQASREAAPESLSAAPAPAAARMIPTQLPANVRPLQYAITATPDAGKLRFSGSTLIDIEVLEPTSEIILTPPTSICAPPR